MKRVVVLRVGGETGPRISRADRADLIVRRIEGPELIISAVEITD